MILLRRLKSIDTFRGLSLVAMLCMHTITWWLVLDDSWFIVLFMFTFDPIGTIAFLFIAGISTSISYNNRKIKAQTRDDYNEKMLRNEYLLRGLILLIIALAFNVVYGLLVGFETINLWRWYILVTIAFSLFFTWPLLKTPKIFRILFGIGVWIFNMFFLEFLLPYEGEYNLFGILFYIFYYKLIDSPILIYFPFLLIGTVFGDIIYEIEQNENKDERLSVLKRNMILPTLIIAPILIIIGVLFKFPEFFTIRGSFSWSIYCIGITAIILLIFVSIEEYEVIKTKKSYRFLYYFSFYSLTIFIFHYPIAFLFYHKLTLQYIAFFIAGTIVLMGLFIRFLNKRIEGKYTILNWRVTFSLKVQMSRMSANIVRKRANKLNSSKS